MAKTLNASQSVAGEWAEKRFTGQAVTSALREEAESMKYAKQCGVRSFTKASLNSCRIKSTEGAKQVVYSVAGS